MAYFKGEPTPPNWVIWIAKHDSDNWKQHSLLVPILKARVPEFVTNERKFSYQLTTMGMGSLVFFALNTVSQEIRFHANLLQSDGLAKIHPSHYSEINGNGLAVFSEDDIDYFARRPIPLFPEIAQLYNQSLLKEQIDLSKLGFPILPQKKPPTN